VQSMSTMQIRGSTQIMDGSVPLSKLSEDIQFKLASARVRRDYEATADQMILPWPDLPEQAVVEVFVNGLLLNPSEYRVMAGEIALNTPLTEGEQVYVFYSELSALGGAAVRGSGGGQAGIWLGGDPPDVPVIYADANWWPDSDFLTTSMMFDHKDHRYVAFLESGGLQLESPKDIEYLIVAGGGGGIYGPGHPPCFGTASGGGGGVLQGSLSLDAGTYPIVVGLGGGPSAAEHPLVAVKGEDSSAFGMTAFGGGGAVSVNEPRVADGGSGGGATQNGTPGVGTPGQGTNGGVPGIVNGRSWGGHGGGLNVEWPAGSGAFYGRGGIPCYNNTAPPGPSIAGPLNSGWGGAHGAPGGSGIVIVRYARP
jgi:hypothetical protein